MRRERKGRGGKGRDSGREGRERDGGKEGRGGKGVVPALVSI
jgi:hypothetical protein